MMRFNSRSREGATCKLRGGDLKPKRFNSRSREGATWRPRKDATEGAKVSIHAPVRERLGGVVRAVCQAGFNSRSREGATVLAKANGADFREFQFTLP